VRPVRTALALSLGLAPAGCRSPTEAPTAPATASSAVSAAPASVAPAASMAAALRKIAEQAEVSNPIIGRAERDGLEAQLRGLSAQAPPEARIETLGPLAEALLWQRETEAAVARLREAAKLVESLPPERAGPYAAQVDFALAVALMRLGENQNCVKQHNEWSCIAPIREGGVHTRPEAARESNALYRRLWEGLPPGTPLHFAARWLLNITAQQLGEWPASVPPAARIAFESTGAEAKFPRFRNLATERRVDRVDLAGGAVAEDFDGDGDLDLVTSTWDPKVPLAYYRNDGPTLFTEAGAEAGLAAVLGGFNLVGADFDNDADVDLLVLRGGWLGESGAWPKTLLRNDGGRFVDVTVESGLASPWRPSQAAAFADYDLDGDLDLFVANESLPNEKPHPCQLLRNDAGRFVDVSEATGVRVTAWSKGTAWGDFDGDADPDLYVSNLHGPNLLFRNDRNGRFTEVAATVGVSGPRDSFATWFWDPDNDGDLDLWVSGYQSDAPEAQPHVWYAVADLLGAHALGDPPGHFINEGGRFRDDARAAGLAHVTLPMSGNYGDLDGDGRLDLMLGTGYPGYEGLLPNRAYRNRGDGTFGDVTFAGGFGHLQKGHGIVFADFDEDGNQEVFVQIGGFSRGDAFGDAYFENPLPARAWLQVELRGVRTNRLGVGARVAATIRERGLTRTLYRWMGQGSSFGSHPHRLDFGLADATEVERLEVFWPVSGETQVFEALPKNRRVRVTEGTPAPEIIEVQAPKR